MEYSLTKNQLLTWQQAFEWLNLTTPKYICFGRFPNTKDGKAFFNPFLKAGYIHSDTLKYTGVFKLTEKGVEKFKQLKKAI